MVEEEKREIWLKKEGKYGRRRKKGNMVEEEREMWQKKKKGKYGRRRKKGNMVEEEREMWQKKKKKRDIKKEMMKKQTYRSSEEQKEETIRNWEIYISASHFPP